MAHLAEAWEFFTSAKTRNPIPVESGAFRDALIRASLDPAVRSIEKVPAPAFTRDMAVVLRADGRFAYGIEGDARLLAPLPVEEPPLRPLILTQKQLYCEPAISNDRLIWPHKARRVSNGIRTQILEYLTSCGPVPFGELVSSLRLPRRSETSVLSMACADLIEIGELAVKPLGPDSPIGCRPTFDDTEGLPRLPVALRNVRPSKTARFSTQNLMINPRQGG